MKISIETWKPVVGFEEQYEVSDLGRVRSLDRAIHRKASWRRPACTVLRKGKLLRPGPSTGGYPSVVLGKGNTRMIHALMLEAFVGPRPEGADCRHLNGDPTDNRLENLCWGTRAENLLDRYYHATFGEGVRI